MEGKLARAESVEDDTKRGMKKLEDEGEDDDTKWPDASVGMGEKPVEAHFLLLLLLLSQISAGRS